MKIVFKYVILLIVFILFTACTVRNEYQQITSSATGNNISPTLLEFTKTPKPTLTPSPIPSLSYTLTPTKIPVLPTPTRTEVLPQVIFPVVNQICPTPAASAAELGFQDTFLLAQVFDESGNIHMESRSAMIVRPITWKLMPIPGTAPKSGELLWEYTNTPDGQWVDLQYVTQARDYIQEVLISKDGQKRKELFSGDMVNRYYKYLFPENLLVIADTSNYNYRPIAVRDLINGTERELPGFADDTDAWWADIFFTSPENEYNFIYWHGKDDRLYLYNDSEHTSIPAFPWISEAGGWLMATPFRDADGMFGIFAKRPMYGLDLAFGLDFQTILTSKPYAEMMKEIHLPGDGISLEGIGEYLRIQRLGDGLLFAERTKPDGKYKVYRLNFANLSLDDFCITVAADDVTISVSPDERFAAINFFRLIPPGFHVTAVVLLNLETGQQTYIPNADYEIVGWLTK